MLEAVDDEETLQLLKQLIAEPSENPPGAEEACARLLAAFLEQRGIACHLAEVAPGRPNLYATGGGSWADARLVRAPRHGARRRRLDFRPLRGDGGRRAPTVAAPVT